MTEKVKKKTLLMTLGVVKPKPKQTASVTQQDIRSFNYGEEGGGGRDREAQMFQLRAKSFLFIEKIFPRGWYAGKCAYTGERLH